MATDMLQPDTWAEFADAAPEVDAFAEFADEPQDPTVWDEFDDEDLPFFEVGDTLSALGDVGRGVMETTPAAFDSMMAGLTRPDKWDPDMRASLDKAETFEREMQMSNLQEGRTDVGNALRQAAGSVGSTLSTLGLAIPAAVVGAKIGAAGGTMVAGLPGTAAGAIIGAGLGGASASFAGAYRAAGARFLYDAFNAYEKESKKRLGRDLTEDEKEEAYQELLPLAQETGLWEAGPEAIGNLATLGAGKVVMGLGKNTLTNLARRALGKGAIKVGTAAGAAGTELATETITSLGQALPQAQADAFAQGRDMSTAVSPYDRPGGTMQALQDVAPATLALSALSMGVAGGASLASRPFRASDAAASTPAADSATPAPVQPGPSLPTIEINGVAYGYDPRALTQDQVRILAETGGLQEFLDGGMVWDAAAPPPGTIPTVPTPVGATAGPTVAEARETLGDTGNVGAAFQGNPGGPRLAPIPRDAQGGLDLLNYLNQNPIRAPRRNTQAGQSAEFEWREAGDFPSNYRSRIMMEGPANMDERAQEAFDNGLIPAPSAEALAQGVRDAIAKRQTDARLARQQTQMLREGETAQVRFETDQQQSQDPAIDIDQLSPGDRLIINGEAVTVAKVQIDDDGRTTDLDIVTPAGPVRVRGGLRGQVAPETASQRQPTLDEINLAMALAAQVPPGSLGAWADGVIESNRGQMNMGVNPVLLVAQAVKAVQAGVKFGKWAADMIRQFGEAVRQYLQGAWNAAKRTSERGAIDIGPGETKASTETIEAGIAKVASLSGADLSNIKMEVNENLTEAGEFKVLEDGTSRIRVKSSLPADQQRSTAAHEALHALHSRSGDGGYTMDLTWKPTASNSSPQLRELWQQIGKSQMVKNLRRLRKSKNSKYKTNANYLSAPKEILARVVEQTVASSNQWSKAPTWKGLFASLEFYSWLNQAEQSAILPYVENWLQELGRRASGSQTQSATGNARGQLRTNEAVGGEAVGTGGGPSATGRGRGQEVAASGFTNTTVVAQRNDGSTVLFGELVGLAERAVQAGVNFARWSADMIRQFGAAVRQYLQGAWQAARRTSQVGAINITPRGVSARRPGDADDVRVSQFGERVNEDKRLDPGLRESLPGQFAVQNQQQAAAAAAQIIAQTGLSSAQARFNSDTNLPMPVRIAGMMQVALSYDAQASLARRRGDAAGDAALFQLVQQAIEAKASLEFLGNEAGRNLAMFNAWARMSPDGQLSKFKRQLEDVAADKMEAETETPAAELDQAATDALNELDIDEVLNEVLNDDAGFAPVNTRTGEGLLGLILGGAESVLRSVADSAAAQNVVRAIDDVLKALSGRLFADPLLLTPMGRAVLTTAKTLILQGQKLATAVANAIADVRTRLNDPAISDVALTRAVMNAVAAEVVKPIMKRLALDSAYNRREALTDLTAAGVPMAQAIKIADTVINKRPKIQKAAQAKMREAIMRRLNPSPRLRAKLNQKLPKAIDILMKAVGGGIARERAFIQAYAAANDLPSLTPAQEQQLQAMAAEVNLLPEGVLRQAKATELLNKMAMIKGVPASEALLSMWYANLLSGITTQGVNLWGNIAGLLRAVGLAGFSPVQLATLARGMVAGLPAGIKEAREAWRTGISFKPLKWNDTNAAGALDLIVAQGGPQSLGQWVAYILSIGGLTRYVFRAMGAVDAVFWNIASEGHAHLAASRALQNQGLKRGTPAFEAAFLQELGGDPSTVRADLDRAKAEIQAAGQPVTPQAVNRRAWEIRLMRRATKLNEASKRFADRLVFQNDPEGIGKLVSTLISALQNFKPLGVPVFIPLVPFNRILANLFENAVDFTGVGILRGMMGHHLTDPSKRFDELERRERIMAGVMGLTAALGALALAMQYADDDDETVPFMVYGGGPPDPNKRQQMEERGWRRNSIKIGNQYVSFAEVPMGPMLGAVGGYMDWKRYSKTTNKTATERLSLALASGVGAFQDLGALKSVKDTLDLMTQDGFRSGKWVKQLALKPVPGFIPAQGLMRDVGRVFDSTKISDDDVWGALVRDVPILKQTGKPKLNILGEPMQYAGVPIVNRFVSGQTKDPVWSWLGENRLIIPGIPPTVEVGRWLTGGQRKWAREMGMIALENGVMTEEQKRAFVIRQGELLRQGITRMKASAGAPSPEQTERLQKHLEAVSEAARKTAMLEAVQRLR